MEGEAELPSCWERLRGDGGPCVGQRHLTGSQRGPDGLSLLSGPSQLCDSREEYLGITLKAFPGSSDGKEPACSVEDPASIPGPEDPLEKDMATTPVFLPGESHAWRSLAGYSPWGHKEPDSTELFHFHFHSRPRGPEISVSWALPCVKPRALGGEIPVGSLM